jgi:hypothetical protein
VTSFAVEQLFIRLTFDYRHFIITLLSLYYAAYFHPSSHSTTYESHMSIIDSIISQYSSHYFIFCGDYNLPDIKWSINEHGMQYNFNSRPRISFILEGFVFHKLLQHNNVPNSHDSVLDLVFSNLENLGVEPTLEQLVPIDSFHPAISLNFSIVAPTLSFDNSHESYQFHRGLYSEINDYLSSFNRGSTFSNLNLNTAVNTFFDALHYTVLTYVSKLRFSKPYFPSWVSKEVKNLIF